MSDGELTQQDRSTIKLALATRNQRGLDLAFVRLAFAGKADAAEAFARAALETLPPADRDWWNGTCDLHLNLN